MFDQLLTGIGYIFLIVVALIFFFGLVAFYLAKKGAEASKNLRRTGKDVASGIVETLLNRLLGKRQEKISEAEEWPYSAKPIMTKTEIAFFERLKNALPHKDVFSQVAMTQVLKFPNSDYRWLNQIARKVLDFVVCNSDGAVLFVVELDDRHHVGRNKADGTKEKALRDAGIILIRWHAEKMPTVPEIRETVRKRLTEHR